MNSIENFTKVVKSLKSKYGRTFFEKSGLHAALSDLANNLDKRFISVLKMADEMSLPEKLNKLIYEEDSAMILQMFNLKQDFIENTGLDVTMAEVVFDAYSFGLGLKPNFNSNDYIIQKTNNELQIIELIKFAFVDNRLNKIELNEIFARGLSMGISDNDIFLLVKKFILDHDLIALTTSNSIKPSCKEVLIGYDWVTNDLFLKIQEIQFSNLNEKEKKQAEQERIELEKLEKKKVEEKAKALRVEQEKKERVVEQNKIQKSQEQENRRKAEERARQERFEQYEKLADWKKPLNQHLLKSNKEFNQLKLANAIITPILIIGIGVLLYYIFKGKAETKDLDADLSKKYEIINALILQNKLDSALTLVPGLVHPSDDCREYNKPNDCKYSYTDYWKMMRSELTAKIEDRLNSSRKDKGAVIHIDANPKEKWAINQVDHGSSVDVIDLSAEDNFNYDVIEVDIDSVNY